MHRCYSRSIFHSIETTMYLFYFNQLRRKSSFLPAVFQFIGERSFFWKASFWKDNSVVQSVTLALKTVSNLVHCLLLPCQNSIQSGSTLNPPQFGMGIFSFARRSSFLCHNHSRLSTIFDWGDAADPAWDALDRDWKYSLDSAVGTFFAFPDKNSYIILFKICTFDSNLLVDFSPIEHECYITIACDFLRFSPFIIREKNESLKNIWAYKILLLRIPFLWKILWEELLVPQVCH